MRPLRPCMFYWGPNLKLFFLHKCRKIILPSLVVTTSHPPRPRRLAFDVNWIDCNAQFINRQTTNPADPIAASKFRLRCEIPQRGVSFLSLTSLLAYMSVGTWLTTHTHRNEHIHRGPLGVDVGDVYRITRWSVILASPVAVSRKWKPFAEKQQLHGSQLFSG